MNDWSGMGPEEFRNTGLLWAVNTFVLWPLGIAVGVRIPDGSGENYFVMALNEPEIMVEGRIDIEKEPGGCHPRERFLHYAETRVLEMPTEMEREMAAKRLRVLFPGFGIAPVREDATE
jgi:hypothetical protein